MHVPGRLQIPRSHRPRRRLCIALVALLLLGAFTALPAAGAQTLRQAAAGAGVLVGVGREAGNPADDRLAVHEFDAMTLEGSLLWNVVEPAPGRWDFRRADRSVAFARRHHLFLTATHFVWDQITYRSTPAWVESITSRSRLEAVMKDHLATISRRYGRAINRWIVVNEPLRYLGETAAIQPNVFSRVLGPNWIADSFRIARRAAPHAQLWLNEIFTETDPAKADALVRIATSLVRQHVPIDGVALQGHLFVPLRPVAPDTGLVLRTLRRLAALGLQVSLTEVDVPTLPGPGRLAMQAARIGGLVKQCLAVRRCTSVTFWDLLDSESWLNSLFGRSDLAPTLFDAARRPHPAYFAVRDALIAARRRAR
ncbi:MAG: endo-1,4-beta-xylanase [Solirubrobacteraceae bacterium]